MRRTLFVGLGGTGLKVINEVKSHFAIKYKEILMKKIIKNRSISPFSKQSYEDIFKGGFSLHSFGVS